MTNVNVRLPTDQYEELRKIAESEHRTFSHEMRRLVEERLQHDQEPGG